jgi:hypothetical protein
LPCNSALMLCLVFRHHALLQGYLRSLPCCSCLVTLSLIVAPYCSQCLHLAALSAHIAPLPCSSAIVLCAPDLLLCLALLFVTPCCSPIFLGTSCPTLIVASLLSCSPSHLPVLLCQLIFPPHSLVLVKELGATTSFIQQHR